MILEPGPSSFLDPVMARARRVPSAGGGVTRCTRVPVGRRAHRPGSRAPRMPPCTPKGGRAHGVACARRHRGVHGWLGTVLVDAPGRDRRQAYQAMRQGPKRMPTCTIGLVFSDLVQFRPRVESRQLVRLVPANAPTRKDRLRSKTIRFQGFPGPVPYVGGQAFPAHCVADGDPAWQVVACGRGAPVEVLARANIFGAGRDAPPAPGGGGQGCCRRCGSSGGYRTADRLLARRRSGQPDRRGGRICRSGRRWGAVRNDRREVLRGDIRDRAPQERDVPRRGVPHRRCAVGDRPGAAGLHRPRGVRSAGAGDRPNLLDRRRGGPSVSCARGRDPALPRFCRWLRL